MARKRRIQDTSDDEGEKINRNAAKMVRRRNEKRLFNDTNLQTDDSDDSLVCWNLFNKSFDLIQFD